MKHVHLIYGNQPLELEEEVQRIIDENISTENRKDAVYVFETSDFYSKDSLKNQRTIGELKNTCDTVSFFSPVIVVHIRDIQNIVSKKKAIDPILKDLEKIVLIKTNHQNEESWMDADGLSKDSMTRFKVSAKQLVRGHSKQTDNSYKLLLDESWSNKKIIKSEGEDEVTISIQDFLRNKLKKQIEFVIDESDLEPSEQAAQNDFSSFLVNLVKNPPSQVELVLSANIKNPKELNQALYKSLKVNANEIKKTIVYDDTRPVDWIVKRAKKKRLAIDTTVADLMIEFCGSDFAVLDKELEKLSLVVPSEESVSADLLVENVSQSKQYTIFRIADYLATRDLRNSLRCLKILINEQSSDPVNIFALISSQFRRLLKIAYLLEQNTPDKLISEQLKLNPWIAKQLIQKSRTYSMEALENIVVYLSKQDLQLKYSSKQVQSKLENICFLICQNHFNSILPIQRIWVP